MRNYHGDRVIFLKEFTKQLIISSKPAEQLKHFASQEKEKKFEEIFFKPIPSEEKKEDIKDYTESIKKEVKTEEIRIIDEVAKRNIPKLPRKPISTKPLIAPKPLFQKPSIPIKRFLPFLPRRTIKQGFKPSIMSSDNISTSRAENVNRNLDFGKLSMLVQDSRVGVIECPGAGEFIVAKIQGKPLKTKIFLNKDEIKRIIEKFSEISRIPITGGMFKAYAGNLLITAVLSDTQNKFTITKINPAFVIGQAGR